MSEKAVFRLITLFLKFLGIISSVLSTRLRTRYGEFLGDMMRFLSPGRYKITYDNLKMAFPKENEDWYYETVVKSYRNLGITLAETLAMPYFKESDIRKYIYYENIELLSDVYKRGKGLLLLSGHYGNWELLAYTAGLFTGIPINVIVKPQKNFIADELLNKYRTMAGNKVISMYNAARGIIQAIKKQEAVAMLADQSATYDKDVFVDFFGIPAATYEAPAALALHYDIPIIMGFAERMFDSSYHIKLIEIGHDDLRKDKEGVLELTRRHVEALEQAIRRKPELWAWQHRRWKHEPGKTN